MMEEKDGLEVDNELKEFLLEMERLLTQQINEVSDQFKVLKTEVNAKKYHVTTVDRMIRIVEQNITATLSGLWIDVELVKGELKERQ